MIMESKMETEKHAHPPEGLSAKSKVASMLLGIKKKPMRVLVEKGSGSGGGGRDSEITPIKKLTDKNLSEIEIQPIKAGVSYIRVNYDNIANDYKYEVIEPELTPDEGRILIKLKDKIINTLRMLANPSEDAREEYLRRATKFLLKDMDLSLNPLSFERVFYYIVRDWRKNSLGDNLSQQLRLRKSPDI